MERCILHCDLNSFFASVECVYSPELRDKPMAVAGDPTTRHGIILARNEPAKRFGVLTAETIWQAKQKCPDLILMPPRYDEYKYFYKRINDIYLEYTDLVEPFGIDESWLDVTGSMHLFGDGKHIADTLRKRAKQELGLTLSAGVSFNKVFAKLGSDYKKPDATTVITRENYKEIVFPLPVGDLLYIGKQAAKRLARLGIKTIGQLAKSDVGILKMQLGAQGELIHAYANGADNSPVASFDHIRTVKSIGKGRTFPSDISSMDDIRRELSKLCDSVGSQLRRKNFKCCTVQVTFKTPDFSVFQRQKSLDSPTNSSMKLLEHAMQIVEEKWKNGRSLRMLTVTAVKLIDADNSYEQISLFDEHPERQIKREKIERLVDDLRDKYGKNIIKIGLCK